MYYIHIVKRKENQNPGFETTAQIIISHDRLLELLNFIRDKFILLITVIFYNIIGNHTGAKDALVKRFSLLIQNIITLNKPVKERFITINFVYANGA
jgi:hypothetical protein